MPISKETAQRIALAYREVEVGQDFLDTIKEAMDRREVPDIRDAFGRRQGGLQLGVPSGHSSHRLFDVDWSLAQPIVEAHIAQHKAIIVALSETARTELEGKAT